MREAGLALLENPKDVCELEWEVCSQMFLASKPLEPIYFRIYSNFFRHGFKLPTEKIKLEAFAVGAMFVLVHVCGLVDV